MKKARLLLSRGEIEYNRRFGILPDTHFLKLKKEGKTSKEASAILDTNLKVCWEAVFARDEENRRKEAEKEKQKYNYVWDVVRPDDHCPF